MGSRRGAAAVRGGGALIPRSKIPAGVCLAHENAARHLGDALCLYGLGRHQGAISPLVLSMGESLKGAYLAAAHVNGRGISAAEWARLQDHDFKLQHARWAERIGGAALAEACARHLQRTRVPILGAGPVDRKAAIKHAAEIGKVMPTMHFIKKASTYDRWNAKYSKWDTMEYLPDDAREALAFYILHLATFCHDLLVCAAPGLGSLCKKTCSYLSGVPSNPFLAADGKTVLEAIHETKLIALYPYPITRNILLKCRRAGLMGGDYDNYHPLVKTAAMLDSELSKARDGTRGYYSNDAGQTYGGEPMMHAGMVATKEGRSVRLEEVAVGTSEKVVAYKAYDSRIDAMLEAEMAIGRLPGREVPLDTLHEAFSRVGIRVRRLRDDEIGPALASARRMDRDGRLAGFPADLAGSIRGATREGWDDLDPAARGVIAAMHVDDPRVLVLSGHTDPVRKYKIRLGIWGFLCAQRSILESAGPA